MEIIQQIVIRIMKGKVMKNKKKSFWKEFIETSKCKNLKCIIFLRNLEDDGNDDIDDTSLGNTDSNATINCGLIIINDR